MLGLLLLGLIGLAAGLTDSDSSDSYDYDDSSCGLIDTGRLQGCRSNKLNKKGEKA